MELYLFAKAEIELQREMDKAKEGYNPEDPLNKMVDAYYDASLELVKLFAGQGHSGMSQAYTRKIFDRLAQYKPLSALTGEDKEWYEIRGMVGTLFNHRATGILKDIKTGVVTHGSYYIFKEPNGDTYTSNLSGKVVTFPYIVTDPVYIEVPGMPSDAQKLAAIKAYEEGVK